MLPPTPTLVISKKCVLTAAVVSWMEKKGPGDKSTRYLRETSSQALVGPSSSSSRPSKSWTITQAPPDWDTNAVQDVQSPSPFPLVMEDPGPFDPLHQAVASAEADAVKELLKSRDLSVDSRCGRMQWTALHMAVEMNWTSMVELLLLRGADSNITDADGRTPLHMSCLNGNLEVCKLLVQSSAKVEVQDNKSATPLHKALQNVKNPVEIAGLLAEEGADLNARDMEGATPLHYAAFSGHLAGFTLLLKKGALITAEDNHGSSPLHWAAHCGHSSCVSYLIRKGISIDEADTQGRTPLILAVSNGHVECAKFLMRKGASLSARDINGATSLHHAAYGGHLELCEFLLEQGADLHARDYAGRSIPSWMAYLNREGMPHHPYHQVKREESETQPFSPEASLISSQSNDKPALFIQKEASPPEDEEETGNVTCYFFFTTIPLPKIRISFLHSSCLFCSAHQN